KGTGRARQGSIRAPHFVGGGTVFGPQPRDYTQKVPRKVRALARKSAFNARASENALLVIDAFSYDAPRTSRLLELLQTLGVAEKKVLILTDGLQNNVFLSGRNRPNVHVMPYADASTYHILWSDVVLVESGALGQSLEPVADSDAAPRRKTAAKKSARKSTGKRSAAPRKAAGKSAARKATAKKSAAGSEGAAPRKRAARKSTSDKPAGEEG